MWFRLACVVLLVGCPKKKEEAASAPAQPIVAIDASVAIVPEPPGDAGDTWAHAKPFVEGEYATVVERYLGAYLDLLWVDIELTEMLAAFPGAPATNRYQSVSYNWKLPDRAKLEKALRTAHAAATHANATGDTDRAVAAYTTKALEVWPRLVALTSYYDGKRFVDDEFVQGRRDAPFVRETLRDVQPLREPMINGIFSGWRAAAGDKTDSPRAIIGASFEACMRAAYLIFGRQQYSDAKKQEAAEHAIDVAMSACRKGVGAVSGLPEAYRSFDVPLRSAAVAFGDTMEGDWARKYATDDVESLVRAYIERWPKLPSEPAEKPQ